MKLKWVDGIVTKDGREVIVITLDNDEKIYIPYAFVNKAILKITKKTNGGK